MARLKRTSVAVAAGVALWLVGTATLAGQMPPELDVAPEIVTITPGSRYAAGWLHQLVLGHHYRDLWATPVRVPVLQLSHFAEGLVPIKQGGGRQTRSLHFQGADGRRYKFRSVYKDPTRALPPKLRESIADGVLQDQISAQHPAAALITDALLEAAGTLHSSPRLYVMPDDPQLGEYRAIFAGMLGTLEEFPNEEPGDTPGFAGSRKVVDTEQLFERLEKNPSQYVDTRAYLTVRLIDILVGDWDRHVGQWRWASFPDCHATRWVPVPGDHDQALVRLDGPLPWLAGQFYRELVGFDDEYPSLPNLTWTARALDRRLLAELERPAWDSVVALLQQRLTDQVIEQAVQRMPEPWYRRNGRQLIEQLQRRRDTLDDAGREFYGLLARWADVHARDAAEVAEVERADDEHVEVRLSLRDPERGSEASLFRRRFNRRETEEIRLYLHGGADSVLVSGTGRADILVRVVGGGGDDVMVDYSCSAGGGRTRFYDHRGDNTFRLCADRAMDRRRPSPELWDEEFAPPPDGTLPALAQVPDWGRRWRPLPWIELDPDLGLFVGGGATRERYGFREFPYAYRLRVRGGVAPAAGRFRLRFGADMPSLTQRVDGSLDVMVSNAETIHFHGRGNETALSQPDQFYLVRRDEVQVDGWLGLGRGRSLRLTAGPALRLAHTDPEPGTLLEDARPYGVGTFAQLGLQSRLTLDHRDRRGAASRGVTVTLGGSLYPSVLSVEETFARTSGTVAAHLSPSLPGDPTLALRAGGEKVWGRYPFHEAAFLGGDQTLRGFSRQRFAGDAAVYGNAEVRLTLTRFLVLLPGDLGVFAFTDAGRVFVEDEQSQRWHVSQGGGIWLAVLDRRNTVSFGVARSREGVKLHGRGGFLF
ncbi:MAG: BamA/TamA family outer membrane protein [Gemmatimonadetes bacterium]|nr:BamA/TamA family outer membrane protein [Gemmatimonadota bacterium]